MIDANKEYGKLHLILEIMGNKDVRKQLEQEFTEKEQTDIYKVLKRTILDDLNLIMQVQRGGRNIVSTLGDYEEIKGNYAGIKH